MEVGHIGGGLHTVRTTFNLHATSSDGTGRASLSSSRHALSLQAPEPRTCPLTAVSLVRSRLVSLRLGNCLVWDVAPAGLGVWLCGYIVHLTCVKGGVVRRWGRSGCGGGPGNGAAAIARATVTRVIYVTTVVTCEWNGQWDDNTKAHISARGGTQGTVGAFTGSRPRGTLQRSELGRGSA